MKIRCIGIIGFCITVAVDLSAGQGWWNYRWHYRRSATVSEAKRSGLPGDDIAVLTMPSGGLIQPDGRDIRITTASGRIVKHRVLMVGPGDVVRIAFALQPPVKKYFVYFGNAQADKPKQILKIQRGVLMETWAYPGGGIANFRQVLGVFRRANVFLGRDFRRDIFIGHNPFGPQNRICSIFTGALLCPRDGDYLFSTTSRDASFLLVDGKVVVRNGGHHRAWPRAVKIGRIHLKKGLHELKVYHVSTRGDPIIVAAWRPPGVRRIWKIPPAAFAPIIRATPGFIEQYGKALTADFIYHHAGETFLANRYLQRYEFVGALSGRFAGKCRYEWDFGDGQKLSITTSAAKPVKCEHVYLSDGAKKVRLVVKVGAREFSRTNVIHVARPWDRITENRMEPLGLYARVVAEYDFTSASAMDIANAIVLFKRTGLFDAIVRAGDALISKKDVPVQTFQEAMDIYTDVLVEKMNNSRKAIEALLQAAKMSSSPAISARLMSKAGRYALQSGNDTLAMKIFSQAIHRYSALTTNEVIRDAKIGIGDVWRYRGNYKKALQAYKQAGPSQSCKGLSPEKRAVRRGDLIRHAEDYIRRRLYDDAIRMIDQWENEFPTDKLEGYSTLMRVKLAMRRKQYKDAITQAEQLIKVNPRSNYAPDLLLLEAQAYKAIGKDEQFHKTLNRLIKDYPESPLSTEAKKMLSKGSKR